MVASIVTNVLLGLSLAVDAFVVSLAIGAKQRNRLSVVSMLGIAFFFGAMQGIMPLIGWGISGAFFTYINTVDHWIAFILLVLIGGSMLRNAGRDEDDHPNASLTLSSIVGLGIATSIDALAVGFTLPTMTDHPLIAIAIIFAVTAVLCAVAFFGAKRIPEKIANPSEFVAGFVLIALAVKTLVTHLFF